ncbi:hypothetical protein IIA79_06565 [bacterium]|nr:hypothetical protein [bacterium]
MRLDGGLAFELPNGDDDGEVLSGDVDGDGHKDLIVELESLTSTFHAYGFMGTRITAMKLQHPTQSPVMGDVDGDGMDELVNRELRQLAAYGRKQKRAVIQGWPEGHYASLCYDLDSDGVDEVIACHSVERSEDPSDVQDVLPLGATLRDAEKWEKRRASPRGGYFKPASGEFVNFEFPDLDYRYNIFTGQSEEIACADILGDGDPEIIVKPAVGTLLFAFDLAGKLVYYEEFGGVAWRMALAKTKSKDHIVIQLDNKVVIYP